MELEAVQHYGRQKLAIEDEMLTYTPEAGANPELPLEERFFALASRLQALCKDEGREKEDWDYRDSSSFSKKMKTITGHSQVSFPESEEGKRDEVILSLQITYEITGGHFSKMRQPMWLSSRWHQNRLCSSMPQECIDYSDLFKDEANSRRILGLIEGSVASAEAAMTSESLQAS